MMNKQNISLRHALAAVAAVMATGSVLVSCQSDDTDFSSIIDATADYELRAIAFDSTALAESDTVVADDNDYYENNTFSRTVYVTYDGDTATVSTTASGITAKVSGAHVTLTTKKSGVHYVLSGASSNGSVKIYSEKKFMMTLSGVSLTSEQGAAINNQCGKSFYLHLADGTTNSLTDAITYQTVTGEDQKGALFSEGQIIFSGTGTLAVTGRHLNGIASDDYIVFRPGPVINVTCTARNCVRGKDGVYVRGGVLNLLSSGDGGKGINSNGEIAVSGGRVTAIVTGAPLISDGDTTGVAALKGDSLFTMTGGTVAAKLTGDGGKGINADVAVTQSGGSLTIETFGTKVLAAPKGIKTDGTLTFSAGEAYIYSANSQPTDATAGTTVASTLTATYSTDKKLLQIK